MLQPLFFSLLLVCAASGEYFSADGQYRVFPSILEPSLRPSADMRNVTVATHMTADRLNQLAAWCSTWQGPISLALYIPSFLQNLAGTYETAAEREPHVAAELMRRVTRLTSDALVSDADRTCFTRHVAWHVVIDASWSDNGKDDDAGGGGAGDSVRKLAVTYPFNVMRNAAADGVVGEWLAIVDIDMQLRPVLPQGVVRPLEQEADEAGLLGWSAGVLPEVGRMSSEAAVSRLFHRLRCDRRLNSTFYGGAVVEVDADLPSEGTKDEKDEADFANQLCESHEMKSKFLVVIPSIETVNKRVPLPVSISDVEGGLQARTMTAFYGHYCRACHIPSNVERQVDNTVQALQLIPRSESIASCRHQQQGTTADCDGQGSFESWIREVLSRPTLRPYRAFYLDKYEPYVILSKRAQYPRFDERFVGRGYDKMSFLYEMNSQMRNFVVMSPGPVLLHHGRGDEPIKDISKEYIKRTRENTQVWEAFMLRMKAKYSPKRQSTLSNIDAGASTVDERIRIAGETRAAEVRTVFEWPSALASCPLDDTPCCVSAHRPAKDLAPDVIQRMQDALSWCCTQISCDALHTFRRHPDHIAYHMDWAFTKYLRSILEQHRTIDETFEHNITFFEKHCDFDGMGKVWFPTEHALRLVDSHQSGANREKVSAGPRLECHAANIHPNSGEEIPKMEDNLEAAGTGSSLHNHTLGLIHKALEWLCNEDVLGNCDSAIRELQLTRTVLQEDQESDLEFRARLLFTLYYQVHWQFESEDAPSACNFEGVAVLRLAPSGNTESAAAEVVSPTLSFRWPTSIASCPMDGVPCCRAIRNPIESETESDDAASARLAATQGALSWACGQVDCHPLHSYRMFPSHIHYHMDWAFTKYLRKILASGANVAQYTNETFLSEHCHFGGHGEPWYPTSHATRELEAFDHLDDPSSLHRGGGPAFECAPLATADAADLQRFLDEKLCAPSSPIGDSCETFIKEMQRTGSVRQREPETALHFRARVLMTMHFQLHWPGETAGEDEEGRACGFEGLAALQRVAK